ncbi:quinoprotein relay system zinc metallohydrolase 1 [Thioflexithrix psekupsensis]|uniref:MBL fold metallo-hydrolase n=1 Tax=Thioflexithrix psekupsensis TaxID=1570016 RepID=A0A251X4F9_9GAMM|nr:quinoprotein relay system zinc metallohydrolase 1 [Thioflexithrix psekupsensis]OUD12079.1 MBL fold metallo-hydrolase [Thioflexithrix psekupsensis]
MKMIFFSFLSGIVCLFSASLFANELDYQLKPRRIAENTYVLIGVNEDFSVKNGGNIINTAFIVTQEGVVVIDTGPSKQYGKQLRAAIHALTDQPIIKVLHTNSHPDRFLGNQAFLDVPRFALAKTIEVMREEADMLTDNLYRMVGRWMQGTEPVLPDSVIEEKQMVIGQHRLEFIALQGHTDADLVILDHHTGVLFAGGLVFFERVPTTPHAHLRQWMHALEQLKTLKFTLMVPSHGEVVTDLSAVEQTMRYLSWLEKTLMDSVEQGESMAEVMRVALPEPFATWGVGQREFERSVTHLYPALENDTLTAVSVVR